VVFDHVVSHGSDALLMKASLTSSFGVSPPLGLRLPHSVHEK
jgi:hypothetical protein